MEKQPFYIPSLDGFRAVAFSIVFLSHAGLERFIPGGFGVTIFFFLSGFLITTLLRREHAKTGTLAFGQFYRRRVIRIWPAFYFVLALGTIATLVHLLPGTIQTVPLLAQALHFANFYSIFHGNDGMPIGTGVYWSLAVEEHFYLVFPLLYLGLLKTGLKPRAQVAVLSLISAAVLAWRCYLILVLNVDDHRTFYATDTRFDSILFGCMLAILGNPVIDAPRGSEKLWKFMLFPLGVAVLLGSLLYRNPNFRETFRYTIQGLALIPIFVAAIRFPTWCPFVPLNWEWVKKYGVLTYPLYLVHFTLLSAGDIYLAQYSATVRGIVCFIVSLLLSLAIHHWIELPVARRFRRHPSHLPSGN